MRTSTLGIWAIIIILLTLFGYTIVGTCGRVEDIKRLAPAEMAKRNWKILRYEGFQYGSWGEHGGKVWYHVANIDNPQVQYRVYVTIWGDELQYHYHAPEVLHRVDLDNAQLPDSK